MRFIFYSIIALIAFGLAFTTSGAVAVFLAVLAIEMGTLAVFFGTNGHRDKARSLPGR